MDVRSRKERVALLARRQAGRVTRAQLRHLGVSDDAIHGWSRSGYLIRVLPRVYAVGHDIPTLEARLWEAVLYAGPGAVISHRSAAHWRELIRHPPQIPEVSTPHDRASITGRVRVFGRRALSPSSHNALPCTSVPHTVLDLAAVAPQLLTRALAQLDYRRELDVGSLERIAGCGRRGSVALRRALGAHQPLLAFTNSELEDRFVIWCERWGLPLPRVNVALHGLVVDAYWPQHSLVVELDGYANHASPAQLRRDRERDLLLRSHGLTVLRYGWELLHRQSAAVHADIIGHMRARG